MKPLEQLLKEGVVSGTELANSDRLIDEVKQITKGIEACSKIIRFQLGEKEVTCFTKNYRNGCKVWGVCNQDGEFTLFSNMKDLYTMGHCNLLNFTSVFNALRDPKRGEFAGYLREMMNEMVQNSKQVDQASTHD